MVRGAERAHSGTQQARGALTELRVPCLSLVSDWSCRNFAHFLLDGLGRLAVFLDATLTLNDVDYVYCPTPPSAPAEHLFERFGILVDKRLGHIAHVGSRRPALRPQSAALAAACVPALARNISATIGRPRARHPGTAVCTCRGAGTAASYFVEYEVEALPWAGDSRSTTPRMSAADPRISTAPRWSSERTGRGLPMSSSVVRERVSSRSFPPTTRTRSTRLQSPQGLEYSYLVARSVQERSASAFGPSPFDFDLELDELARVLPAGGRADHVKEPGDEPHATAHQRSR